MPPKAKRCTPELKSGSVAAKKARTCDAAAVNPPHPTLALMTEVLDALDVELKALEQEHADPFAGIAAFSYET